MSVQRSRRLPAAALALVTAASGRAAADEPELPEFSNVGQLAPASKTTLRVEREALSFDCYTRRAEMDCDVAAAYHVVNPSQEREQVSLAFNTYEADWFQVTVDGRLAALTVTPAPEAPTSKLPRGPKEIPENKRASFTLEVAPGGAIDVVVKAVVPLGYYIPKSEPYLERPPGEARHPLLGKTRNSQTFVLDYLMAPADTWASVGTIDVSVRYPWVWQLHAELAPLLRESAPPPIPLSFTEQRDGSALVATARTSGRRRDRLALAFPYPQWFVENGGPFVGVGGRVGPHGGFRLRAGYEIVLRRYVFTSLAVESDVRQVVTIVPAAEVVSPAFVFFPTAGIGVGAPVQVAPDVRGGVRVQASLFLFPVGFFAGVDIFPKPDPVRDPQVVRVNLMAQVGL